MDEQRKLESLKEVTNYWSLSAVNLSYSNLTFFDGKGCTYLRMLNLSHNDISRISNMNCPALIVLLIKHNKVTDIHPLSGCPNLRYLDASWNMISELKVVQKMPRLMELRIQENNFDLLEVEYFRSLISLSHLRITPNPCLETGMPRLMMIFTLPQLRFLDGTAITPEEILQAENAFNPPFSKLAFEDHANRLLDKACQSGNMAFDEFCKMHPVPPILLLIGSFKSNMQQITNYLQDKFRHLVMIGGVHSTATTIESGDQVEDIPISPEVFSEMKNRGEFLAISHILGRVCGFATSQISTAAERGAVLVAPVPLEAAISLRKWRICPKVVLILPTSRPHFNVDDFLEAEAEKEKEGLEYDDELEAAEHHYHKIKFTEGGTMLAKIHGILCGKFMKVLAPDEYPGEQLGEHDYFSHPRHSILKSQSNQSVLSDLDDEQWSEQLLNMMAGLNDNDTGVLTERKISFLKMNRKFCTFVKLEEAIDQLDREMHVSSEEEGGQEEGMQEEASINVTDKPPGNVALQLQQTAGEIKSNPDISAIKAALKLQLNEDEAVEAVTSEDRVPREVFADETQYTVIKLYSHVTSETTEIHSPKTESEHDYGQISPIMEQAETESKKVSVPSSFPENDEAVDCEGSSLPSDEDVIWTETRALSNVKFSEVNPAQIAVEVLDIEAEDKIKSRRITAYTPSMQFSGSNPSIESISDKSSMNFANEEVDGEGTMSYEPFSQGSAEPELKAVKPEELQNNLLGFPGSTVEQHKAGHPSSGETESHHTHNKFKHRDAMEKAILKTRTDYQQFHLENPGFFTAVYETSEAQECDHEIELLVHDMLQDFRKERESKFRLFISYAGGAGDASDKLCRQDQRIFLQHRMDQFRWSAHEWNHGYQQPSVHVRSRRRGSSEGGEYFWKSSCPKNLFNPKLPRRFNKAKLQQLEKAGELRQRKLLKAAEKLKMKQAQEAATAGEVESVAEFLHEHMKELGGRVHDEALNEGIFSPEERVEYTEGMKNNRNFEYEFALMEDGKNEESFTVEE